MTFGLNLEVVAFAMETSSLRGRACPALELVALGLTERVKAELFLLSSSRRLLAAPRSISERAAS